MKNFLTRSIPSTLGGRFLWYLLALSVTGLLGEFLLYILFGTTFDPLSSLGTVILLSGVFAVMGQMYQRAFKDDHPKQ